MAANILNRLSVAAVWRTRKAFAAIASVPFHSKAYRAASDVSPPAVVGHMEWADFLTDKFNKQGLRVLEIGSRNVTGANLRTRFSKAEYVGFDFMAGDNVDIVGDAHKLSDYFQQGDKFDLIFSSAVFEHLYAPWLVAQEIQKLLSMGGHVFTETHFSFSSHERPWNFFQFSDMGLRALFNDGLGFELIDKGMSNPMIGYFALDADKCLRGNPIPNLYCHSGILCKKVREVPDFNWADLKVDQVVDGSRYPQPK